MAAVATFATGCGSSTKANSSTSTSSATTVAGAAGSTATTGGSTGGTGSSVSVNGKTISANFTASCAKQGSNLALALTDPSNATYGSLSAGATVTGTSVSAAAIGGTKGGANGLPYALAFGAGAPGASASVSNSGNTYTVTGKAVDASNPTSSPVPFTEVFACSTVVGG
jgi:lipoprotein LpqH